MPAAQAEERRRPEQRRRRGPALQLLAAAPRGPRSSGPVDDDADEVAERRVAELAPPLELVGEEAGTSWRAASASGRASGWKVCTSTRPGASRPLRPASCVTSWNVRSSARKSGRPRPVSASTTAASSTPAKWWPFATICVPSSTARSVSRKRRSAAASSSGFAAGVGVEPDQLELGHLGGELPLEPLRARADPRELGRAAGRAGRRARAPTWPQWWQCRRPSRCSTSATSQLRAAEGRPAGAAVERGRDAAAVEQQDRLAAAARRSARARRAAAPRAGSRPRGGGRRRAPAAAAPPSRSPQLEPLEPLPALRPRRRAPVDARPRPRARPASPRPCARRSADRTPACTTESCSSSTQIRPRPRIGAKIAERAPTTIRASPLAIRSRSSRRSASVSPEWRIATESPKRARKRPTVCGASAISGTSTIVPSPRSSAAAQAWR